MFTAALSTTAKTWKQPRCPSTEEWIKKMWCIHTMKYCSAINKNEIMPYAATWMYLSQFSSVTQSCPTLCNPINHSTLGLTIHHQLQESTQTHVHRVIDAIQPCHTLSSPSPPAFNLSQHQGLFQRVSSSHQVAKVLSFSFSISPSNEYSGLISFRMD